MVVVVVVVVVVAAAALVLHLYCACTLGCFLHRGCQSPPGLLTYLGSGIPKFDTKPKP